MSFGSALRHAWNVFTDQQRQISANQIPVSAATSGYYQNLGTGYAYPPDAVRIRVPNERSIISSIFTRLSIDVASVEIRHVRLDSEGRYDSDMDSGLNECLTVEANLDQAARALRQDIALTLFDRGCAAIVPVDTSLNPLVTGGYDILTLRVGEVIQWYPQHVRVRLYNEAIGIRQEITLPKSVVAIVENPLAPVMNEPLSTMQRLLRKLGLLDAVDEASASGKLDLIIQLPYVIKSEARRQQAEQRRTDIEFQLKGSKYGIAYTDGTEKITQLNRPVENNLMTQIEFLTGMLYSQLGLTTEVMNGTADEKTMLNYWNRTIDPILCAIVEAMRRTFLTKTARTQGQSILYFKDVFSLVPVENLADIADKFTRNEIMTSNEMRQVVGLPPHPDPKADQLINSNMPVDKAQVPGSATATATADSPNVGDMVNNLVKAGNGNGNSSSYN